MLLISCSDSKVDYTIIEGVIDHNTSENVRVIGADFDKEFDIEEDGTFRDTLFIKNDGFYEMLFGREAIGVYLEKGKHISFSFDESQIQGSLEFSGEGAEINNFLVKKSDFTANRMDFPTLFGSNEKDFLEALDRDEKALDSLYEAHNLSKKYRDILVKEDQYYSALLIENYESAHGYYAQNPDVQVSPSFYERLKAINFKDTAEFRKNSSYRDLVETHYTRLTTNEIPMGESGFSPLFLKKIDAEFPNGYAKDKIMFNHLQFWLSPDEHMDEVVTLYKNTNPKEENLQKINERYEILKEVVPGKASPTFNYENFKGGNTSLEDLRGKYVYIDVWATWCGPCLQEIPFLQEFEKDYADKNIQVVSISIDQEKDYNKWRDMVENRNLGGIQLMADADWKSDFVQQYGIMGIPRFILLDPEGKIVSPDAYRPSNPKLREQVDALL